MISRAAKFRGLFLAIIMVVIFAVWFGAGRGKLTGGGQDLIRGIAVDQIVLKNTIPPEAVRSIIKDPDHIRRFIDLINAKRNDWREPQTKSGYDMKIDCMVNGVTAFQFDLVSNRERPVLHYGHPIGYVSPLSKVEFNELQDIFQTKLVAPQI